MNAQYAYLATIAAYVTLAYLVGVEVGRLTSGRPRRPRSRERAQVAAQLDLVRIAGQS